MSSPSSSVFESAARALRVDVVVDWLGRSLRNRVLFAGAYVAMGVGCVVVALLGYGRWPN